ncbi:type II toxin-antitoxin system RelE/ParE family toxin [Pseudomonas capsici]|uniref:type II toxin-antitoxin system RelE/ParE family toxin n=1 Tax=Pseudomonas capsici TaxID=2810614 RepID=UPI000E3C357B|nr:type II toxin-antitoxin system RelE/ParE family toxin [Pseudomonas capsici]MBX8606987.1 type II toxin-antitoxin system RelE/ParE family toxin [Pseudomonas cichorii]MCV4344158.1 type II toxin-antitoxin system RelE/ParE family toxin [Pseudomonas capsici]
MPTIALTEKAQSDLLTIHEHYVSHSGIQAANEVIFHILARLEQLTVFSATGRPTQYSQVRELVFTRYPFIAPYQIKGDQIQVLRVRHQRKLPNHF